jgi:NadR type nicotinamide-nucleotide adenylyltransferase
MPLATAVIRKIVLFGPESTGKTTLAAQLAAHYRTVWVPEFSRFYQEQKGAVPDLSDVLPIAEGQLRWEAEAWPRANRLLICDTDVLETKVYSEAYNGTAPPALLREVEKHLGDFYLLADIDLPWVPDGIRDRPDAREEMYYRFRRELQERQLPFAVISGNIRERLEKAIRAIEAFLHTGAEGAD